MGSLLAFAMRSAAVFVMSFGTTLSSLMFYEPCSGVAGMIGGPGGQMGTKENSMNLQLRLKQLIGAVGWSQSQLARILYTELHDIDDETEILRFQERLKKELRRATTKVEKLEKYLSIVMNHDDVKRMNLVINRYLPPGLISASLTSGMEDISREVGDICVGLSARNRDGGS